MSAAVVFRDNAHSAMRRGEILRESDMVVMVIDKRPITSTAVVVFVTLPADCVFCMF